MNLMQSETMDWALACFGPEIAADKVERNHRFMEEALELVQSTGCTKEEVLQLVDYVYSREIGDTIQEVGGAGITLMALCNAHEIDFQAAVYDGIDANWGRIDKIREKQKAKPKFGPLPQ